MSKAKRLKMLTTVSEVLEALGGFAAAGRLVGYTKPQAPWNWTVQHTLPKDTYDAHIRELRERGFDAPASLWAQKPRIRSESAA